MHISIFWRVLRLLTMAVNSIFSILTENLLTSHPSDCLALLSFTSLEAGGQEFLEVLEVMSGLISVVMCQHEPSGNVIVVVKDGSELLLNLDLDLGEVVVDSGKFAGLGVEDGHFALGVLACLEVHLEGLEFGLNGRDVLLKRQLTSS